MNNYETILNNLKAKGQEIDEKLSVIRKSVNAVLGMPIKSRYMDTIENLDEMIDDFYDLHESRSLDRRLKEKARHAKNGALDIVNKLSLLLELDYSDSDMLETEKNNFKTKVLKVSEGLKNPNYMPVTSDIETLHDIGVFIIKRAEAMKPETQTPGKTILKPFANQMKLDDLEGMSKDTVYEMFANRRIFSFIKKTEEQNSSFDYAARAYQHTNEPMHRLYEDLKLDLSDQKVLTITCSGDPIGFFSGLGAKQIVCFDTSYKATLYGEFKTECIKELSYDEFRKFFRIEESEKGDAKKIYEKRIRHTLSEAAKNSFDVLFENGEISHDIIPVLTDERFFRNWGFASPVPQANLFTQSEEHYNKAKKMLKKQNPVYIPGSLIDLVQAVDTRNSFDAVYLSNAPDHFTDESGQVNPTAEVLKPFYEVIDTMLKGPGSKILFNFQWGYRAVEGSKKALAELGYSLNLTKQGNGCGKMAIAEKN